MANSHGLEAASIATRGLRVIHGGDQYLWGRFDAWLLLDSATLVPHLSTGLRAELERAAQFQCIRASCTQMRFYGHGTETSFLQQAGSLSMTLCHVARRRIKSSLYSAT